jgi:hypothetical protein
MDYTDYIMFPQYTVVSPYSLIQYPRFTAARIKIGKSKKQTFHKFQNARQVRTGRNLVQSSRPNAPSTRLISLCPCTHAKTSESLTYMCTTEREKVHCKCTVMLLNVGNVLLCVIYQLNFTVFTCVARISRYTRIYIYVYIYMYMYIYIYNGPLNYALNSFPRAGRNSSSWLNPHDIT